MIHLFYVYIGKSRLNSKLPIVLIVSITSCMKLEIQSGLFLYIGMTQTHLNFSQIVLLKNTNLEEHFLFLTFFDGINFQILLLLKWCPIFDSLPLIQNSKSIISFEHLDPYAKIFPMLYSPLENSTTGTAIMSNFFSVRKHLYVTVWISSLAGA